ncbi:MAG TPA: choice-of-anchor P family protein [Streptosporangiaceae bacterium]
MRSLSRRKGIWVPSPGHRELGCSGSVELPVCLCLLGGEAPVIRRIQAFGLVAIVLAAGNVVAQSAVASAATGEVAFAASGFGSEVTVSSVVQSGRSALSTLGCTSQVGITHTNTVASVGTPVLSAGAVNTSAASQSTATGVASVGTADVASVSLLGGLVSATEVKSVSTTSQDSSTGALGISSAGTVFTNLTVLGLPITATPAPNTKITLPGVGFVELNQQSGSVEKRKAHLTVIGIHVVVTLSTPLAAIGTSIIVADANSSLGGPNEGILNGLAYGAHANVLNTIIAGELFPQPLACTGTFGVTKTNSGVALSIPAILTSGTVVDTAEGKANPNHASAETSSTIEGLNLANGLVTATAIKADVTATGNPPVLGDNSSFLNLAVSGFPAIGDNPAPNTKLNILGIGTLWLHRVIKTANSIKVIMVQLIVSVPGNPLGLGVGTTVNVAFSKVGIS